MKTQFNALALTASLLCHGVALAQSADRPWYVGLTQDFTYDSNVASTSSVEPSDTISTTSLRAGFNMPFGRQRAFANGTFSHIRYNDFSARDNNPYSIGAGLDWSTVERLSGSIALNSQRQQTEVNVGGFAPVTIRNLEDSNDLEFRARLGVVTEMAFEVGLGYRRVNFSAPQFADREYKQDSANLGLVWRPSGILSLSGGVSAERTRYLAASLGQPAPDEAKRQDVYVGAEWVPTGASTVNARVSVGSQEYDLGTAADFEGVTGSLVWNWRPTSRLGLVTTLSRDSGQDSGFLRLTEGSDVTATDFSQVSNRIGIAAQYELTGKINLSAALNYQRRNLVDGFTGLNGRDDTTGVTLGARWAATRTLAFGCEASSESRTATGAGSSEYDRNRFGCFGSFTLD